MKKNIFLILLPVLVGSFLGFHTSAFALTPAQEQQGSVQTSAQVGDFYFSLSGIIAPYASISLISAGNTYKAVSADSAGKFAFSGIRINRGFSEFCLNAIDWKILGESYACLAQDPAVSDMAIKDVFLPPTMSLNAKQITEGQSVTVSGYSMPNAQVELSLNNLKHGAVKADFTGYYFYQLEDLKKGNYEIYVIGLYEGRYSLAPAKKLQLAVISVNEYYLDLYDSALKWVGAHLYYFNLLLLLLVVVAILVKVYWRKIKLFFLLYKKSSKKEKDQKV